MIRRWAMTDRSKRGHEVSQLEGQAITHRHPPVSPSDTDRRENDAHSQLAGRGLRHLNKAAGGDPLNRGGGSIGINSAVRSGLLIAPERDACADHRTTKASNP